MGRFARAGAMVCALAVTASVALTGCGQEPQKPAFVGGPAGASETGAAAPVGDREGNSTTGGPTQTVPVSPADGATNRPVSTEITTDTPGVKITDVTLTATGGKRVAGAPRTDGSSWVPATPLKYGARYTATITGTGSTGPVTGTTTFTTMKKPRSLIGSGLYLFDDKTYGVAMPVVTEFSPGIAKKDRAAVQKRMFVTTDPPQPGAWHWVANGTQAYYRAAEYWKPGTKITVRIALEGIPLSNGRYGNVDRRATATIGRAFEMKVENATKQMTVYENGQAVKTIPVSLGKKKTPSSSGTMVVMEKMEATVFDTRDDPDPANRYVTEIDFAQRLTWGGEYIHAAPWSVQHQGRTNVSHGCVNVSMANARWLFQRTIVGDPITITGTERKLASGNGWTAWDLSWADFVKGSALPVPDGGEGAPLAS